MRSDGAPALDVTIAPTWTGVHTFTPAARTSGSASYLTINMPADNPLAGVGAESIGINVVGNTRTFTKTVTFPLQREIVISAPTYAMSAASGTFTTAITFDVASPIAGTNATITNSYAARFVASAAGHVPIVAKAAASQTGNLQEWQNSSGTALAKIDANGGLAVTCAAVTTGSPLPSVTITGPAHTGLTASTESIGAKFDFSATKQFSTGDIDDATGNCCPSTYLLVRRCEYAHNGYHVRIGPSSGRH